MKRPSSTSIHEAAHSCIAYIIGPTPTYIYSNPDRYEGYVEFDRRFRLTPKDWAAIYLAGSCAEHLWCMGEDFGPSNNEQISLQDLIQINKLKLNFTKLGRIQKEVYNSLKKMKTDVFKVAEFLDEYESIHSAKEFKMVLLEELYI